MCCASAGPPLSILTPVRCTAGLPRVDKTQEGGLSFLSAFTTKSYINASFNFAICLSVCSHIATRKLVYGFS
jgi:hypothetical protein